MVAPPAARNAFLSQVSAAESGSLSRYLTSFDLRLGACLHKLGDAIEDVIFPHSGLIAMTVPLHGNAGGGVIFVGTDGIIGGFAAAASAPAASHAEVRIAGRASRMPATSFRYLLDHSPAIRTLAARFDSALLAQAQQTALCNAAHPVEARICRLLIEVQDRSGASMVPLTQATLAQMLSVRRTTITLVAGRLEAAGVLNCRRGYVQINNREELERRTCKCYGHVRNYVSRLFAPRGDGVGAIDRGVYQETSGTAG